MGAAMAALALSAQAAGDFDALPAKVTDRMLAAGIPREALAVVVRRAGDGGERLAIRAQDPVAPASTLKLLTSIVALETLGPGWRGTTELAITGAVRGGVLHGDLVLKGAADVDFDRAALQRMLLRLRLHGIREIRGDLFLDRSHFTPTRIDVGVPPFDEAPEFRYNVIPDALMLGMNLVDIELVSDGAGLQVAATPPVDGVAFESRMELADAPCDDWEDLWHVPDTRNDGRKLIVTLHGRFPRDCAASTAINVVERDRLIEGAVRAIWTGLGGRWRGHARERASPVDARPIARHRSRPLGELVRDIGKDSDNPITRMVFLALGASPAAGTEATTAARAEGVVRRWLASHGLDDGALVIENGSGLSRRERISVSLLADVLSQAGRSPWAPEFEASLTIVGVDGMATRAKAIPPGAARIKTGTLRNSSAVAGWVASPDGERFVVAAIVNHERADKRVARPVLDALLEWIARGMPKE